jgi:competence protein ComEC
MFLKRFKSLLQYIFERKIFVVILTYISCQILFAQISWLAVGIFFIMSLALLFKYKILFLVVFVTLSTFCLRNYIDLNTESNIRDFVEENYLNKVVELEGFVSTEPIYKNEYARVVFKIEGERSFYLQGNVPRFPRLKVGQVCKISGNVVEPLVSEDFDYKQYLKNKRIYYIAKYPSLNCTEERKGFFPNNMLMDLKSKVRAIVEKRLSEPQASLFLGVLFGEKRVFEEEFQEALRVASITHIIVASGYNVSIIFLGINKVFFFVPKRLRTLLSIVLIWIYCALVGFTPSIIRASIMLSLTLIAIYYGTVSNIHIVFFSSAFFFIFLNPRILTDVGFLLSSSATAGLIYLTPILDIVIKKSLDFSIPFEKLKSFLYKFLQNYFIPSLACTIITMPLIAYFFQKISIVGVVTNVLILPVLEYTLILGFVSLFFNLFSQVITNVLFLTIWAQLKYFELVVNFLGNLERVAFNVDINVFIVFGVYIFLFAFILISLPLDAKNHYLNLQEDF